jgi:hypothetical protein
MESKRSGATASMPHVESGTREATTAQGSFGRPEIPQLNTQRSLKQTLQEVKLVQVSIYGENEKNTHDTFVA